MSPAARHNASSVTRRLWSILATALELSGCLVVWLRVAVNLADCVSLTNEGVSMLADTLPGLLDLCLFGCLQLTDNALLGFGRMDHRIQRLNLGGVYKVSEVWHGVDVH